MWSHLHSLLLRLLPPPTPARAFSKAARLGRWPQMIDLLESHPELALSWRGFDPVENAPFSATSLASRVGMPTLVKALLDAGASPDDVDHKGDSPLHQIATRAHRFSEAHDFHLGPHGFCALMLMEQGASVNRPNLLGYTPIALCAMERKRWLLLQNHSKSRAQERLMMLLAEHEADPLRGIVGQRASDFLDVDFLDRLICIRERRTHLSAYGRHKSLKDEDPS